MLAIRIEACRFKMAGDLHSTKGPPNDVINGRMMGVTSLAEVAASHGYQDNPNCSAIAT